MNNYSEEINRATSRSLVLGGSETEDVIRDNLSRLVTCCVGTAGRHVFEGKMEGQK